MKALLIIAPEGFRDEEYLVPKSEFEKKGIAVTTASTRSGIANGKLGAKANIDTTVDKVNAADFDAVAIVGGPGAEQYLFNNKIIHKIVKDAYAQGKVVAAICISSVVLANAGVLEGKKATVFVTPETVRALKERGAIYREEGVVVDGKIVTAQGPSFAKPFAEAITSLLRK